MIAAGVAALGGADGIVLRLMPAVSLNSFELSRLAPSRCNVRWGSGAGNAAAGSGTAQQQQQQQGESALLPPTPYYNAAVLADVLLLPHQLQLEAAAAAAGGNGSVFRRALLLLKLWCQRRGLSEVGVLPLAVRSCYSSSSSSLNEAAPAASGSSAPGAAAQRMLDSAATVQAGGLSGHMLSWLLVAAVQRAGGGAAVSMTPLQLLRGALALLAERTLLARGGGVTLARDTSVPAELQRLVAANVGSAGRGRHGHATPCPAQGSVSRDAARTAARLDSQCSTLPPPPPAAEHRKAVVAATAAAAAASWSHSTAAGLPQAAARGGSLPLLLDPSGHANLAVGVPRSLVAAAAAAAARCLALLGSVKVEPEVVYGACFGPGCSGAVAALDYAWTLQVPLEQAASSSILAHSSSSILAHSSSSSSALGDEHPMRCVCAPTTAAAPRCQ